MVFEMITTTIDSARKDLSDLFHIGTGLSFIKDDRFYICRFETDREELRSILSKYFSTHMLEPGWRLVLDPIEYIFNEFYFAKV